MAIDDHYDSTFHVKSRTRTGDGMGGWTESWGYIITNSPCRVWQLSAREIDRYKKKELNATHGLLCVPQDAAINESHKIENPPGGTLYNVLSVDTFLWAGQYWKIILERIE